jgi:hypothetical protein
VNIGRTTGRWRLILLKPGSPGSLFDAYKKVVEILLGKGADVNAQGGLCGTPGTII